MQPDLHTFLLRQIGALAFRTHIETDNDGVRSRGQQDVTFGNRADSGVNYLDTHLFCRHLLQRISQHFNRSRYVALKDERQFLDARLFDLLGKALPARRGKTSPASASRSRILRNWETPLALSRSATTRNVSPASGMLSSPRISTGVEGPARSIEPSAIVKHGTDLAEGVAHDEAVAIACSVPFWTRTVATAPRPRSSLASITVPTAERSGVAFRF